MSAMRSMFNWVLFCLGQTLTLTIALSLSLRAFHPNLAPGTFIGTAIVAAALSILFALALLESDSIHLSRLTPAVCFLLGLVAQCAVWVVWLIWLRISSHLRLGPTWSLAVACVLCVTCFCAVVNFGARKSTSGDKT